MRISKKNLLKILLIMFVITLLIIGINKMLPQSKAETVKTIYVNIEELNKDDIILMKDSTILYTLEWYWEDSDELDTIVGTQSNYEDEYYTLRINLQASESIK